MCETIWNPYCVKWRQPVEIVICKKSRPFQIRTKFSSNQTGPVLWSHCNRRFALKSTQIVSSHLVITKIVSSQNRVIKRIVSPCPARKLPTSRNCLWRSYSDLTYQTCARICVQNYIKPEAVPEVTSSPCPNQEIVSLCFGIPIKNLITLSRKCPSPR